MSKDTDFKTSTKVSSLGNRVLRAVGMLLGNWPGATANSVNSAVTEVANTNNPLLSGLGAIATAVSMSVRGGFRGESGLCDALKVVSSLSYDAGLPGHEQVRVLIAWKGMRSARNLWVSHLRAIGLCGMHVVADEDIVYTGGELCKGHGCLKITVRVTSQRTTVAAASHKLTAPQELEWHAPCCGKYANPSHTKSCVWYVCMNGPGWETELVRLLKDNLSLGYEAESNVAGPAGNGINNDYSGRNLALPITSTRIKTNLTTMLVLEYAVGLLISWLTESGPLLTTMATRKVVSRYINGPSNKGLALLTQAYDGQVLWDDRGKPSSVAINQEDIVRMKIAVWFSGAVGLLTLATSAAATWAKYAVWYGMQVPSIADKVVATGVWILGLFYFLQAVLSEVRSKQHETDNRLKNAAKTGISADPTRVHGNRWLLPWCVIGVAATLTTIWVPVVAAKASYVRIGVEILLLLAWIALQCAGWVQQYVHGGAIDPRNWQGIVESWLCLAGAMSVFASSAKS